MTDEDVRLAHLAACEAEARAGVPAAPRGATVPDHEAELMVGHKGTVQKQTFSVAGEAAY